MRFVGSNNKSRWYNRINESYLMTKSIHVQSRHGKKTYHLHYNTRLRNVLMTWNARGRKKRKEIAMKQFWYCAKLHAQGSIVQKEKSFKTE